VASGTSTVDVALSRDVFKMEEIVVTGQATGVNTLRVRAEIRLYPSGIADVYEFPLSER
jgi:hypothetical protein